LESTFAGHAVCGSPRVTRVGVVMDLDTIRKIEALPERKFLAHRFTPEEDDVILRYWKIKNQREMARLMGLGLTTLKKRYKKLTGGEHGV
jgi:DNA-directed RNA polymerase specialized sigma24 family protein